MDGRSYVKILLRSCAILNVENDDKCSFLWSILAYLHPCNNNHPNKVANYKQNFIELSIEVFDFTNRFTCSDVHKINELNNLSVNIFELNFCQDQNKWRPKLIPIDIRSNDSDGVIDLIIYKNHYAPNKKLNVFLGDHLKSFVCRRCLNIYTSENMFKIHKPKCDNNDITTIRTSSESHFFGKNIFIRIQYFLGYMQISKLIMKSIILV